MPVRRDTNSSSAVVAHLGFLVLIGAGDSSEMKTSDQKTKSHMHTNVQQVRHHAVGLALTAPPDQIR